MASTQFAREQCRQALCRPHISLPGATQHTADSCRLARRTFSQSHVINADDKEGGRIRQPKTPTRLRRSMYAFFATEGRAFTNPFPGSTNYLTSYDRSGVRKTYGGGGRDRAGAEPEVAEQVDEDGDDLVTDGPRTDSSRFPFPLNKQFKSEAVLSEDFKDAIYTRVVKDGKSVSAVGAEFNVDMRRVAAVVRLKEVEKLWAKEGKQFADRYASAVMGMLPQSQLNQDKSKMRPHESINDLPVHPATQQQIFYPAAESREITRQDAAKIFSPTLLPADKRVPHPELIEAQRLAGGSFAEATRIAESLRATAAQARAKEQQKREADEAARTTVVKGSRWGFKFEAIDAGAAGKDGRGAGGVGWRYGVPFEDRQRGHLKGVPTKVEV